MTNKQFLKRVSKLQKEFSELYGESGLARLYGESGLGSIREDCIYVSARKFHKLEKEGLLEHISKKLSKNWSYEAMTPQGVKIKTNEFVSQRED